MIYNLLKFLHILGVIAWIGGMSTVAVLNARFSRQEERSTRLAMIRQTASTAAFVIMPGAVTALLSGIAMMAIAKTGFPLWVDWGLAAIGFAMLFGATFMRRTTIDLAGRLASGAGDVQALERRLAMGSATIVVVLLSAVWAMVFKPVLGM